MTENSILNQIASINDLHMIRFYRLFSENGPICGILAYYQDKTINLCTADAHFYELFDRIVKVYERESSQKTIITDDETLRVLSGAGPFSEDIYQKMLSGYKKTFTPVIAPKAFTYIYTLPIIKYIIQTLYESPESGISFDIVRKQCFSRGILDAYKNGQSLHYPYQIKTPSDHRTEVSVLNVLSAGNSLSIIITFGMDGLNVSYSDRYYRYHGDMVYHPANNLALMQHSLWKDETQVFCRESEYPADPGISPSGRICAITGIEHGSFCATALPWGGSMFSANKAGCDYRIYYSQEDEMGISLCLCCQNLSADDEPPIPFMHYALRLYERSDICELHMLDAKAPGSGSYQDNYAGNCYTIAAG